MSEDYLVLKGVTNLYDDNLDSNLLYGIADFFKWSTLGVGGFSNVTITPNISGVYGNNFARLRPVVDPRYTNGKVWEGFRGDWVWETGINYTVQPISISGIYINSSFLPINSGYYIDYPRGRVVFDTAISTLSNVSLNFSHRTVSFLPVNNNLIPDIFLNSYTTNSDYIVTSGNRSQISELKRSLPLVAIDTNPSRRYAPLQLGGGQWCYQDVVFYVLAEYDNEKRSLVDMLSLQNDRTIWIYDRAVAKTGENYPFNIDFRGSLVNSPMQYPEIIQNYSWRKISFSTTRNYNAEALPYGLCGSIVQTTFIIPMGNI